MARRGNCYVASEAIYHILGGKASGWKPMTVRHEGQVHWYLQRYFLGWPMILDLTKGQFKKLPPYEKGRGRGFLTRGPSKRARALMEEILWQQSRDR